MSKLNFDSYSQNNKGISFENAILDCLDIVNMAFGTKYNDAMERCEMLSSGSLHHSIVKTLLLGFKDLLTMEKEDLQATIESCRQTSDLCDKYRRNESFVRKMIFKTDYNDYTEEQVQAILVESINRWILGLSYFFVDQSIMNMIKGLWQLRAGHNLLRSCNKVIEQNYQWKSLVCQLNFLSGLKLAQGVINLFLSHMPDKLMMIFNWAGYSCNIQHAYELLDESANQDHGLLAPVAKIIYCLYEVIVVPFFDTNDVNFIKLNQLIDKELSKPEQSPWFIFIKAMVLKLSGDLDQAIEYHNKAIKAQDQLVQMHIFCYWDMTFIYGIKFEWEEGARCAQVILEKCNWSKATFKYFKAAYLYMNLLEQGKSEQDKNKEEVSQLFRGVPELKQRFAGRTIPPEKYVCVRAEKYFKQNETLPLPAFDLFYIWNCFNMVKTNPKLINRMIDMIDNAIQDYHLPLPNHVNNNNQEDHMLLLLIKGVCLRINGKLINAEKTFKAILERENQLNDDKHLLAMASVEIGLTKLQDKSYIEAEHWFKSAKNNYSGYLFEMMNLMRLHSGLQRIKAIQNK